MHIIEKRVENSGIPQGIFLKRHKVPKVENSQDFYSWKDLNLGINLALYGRVFRVIDCDDFTRKFYSNEGFALNRPENFPDDPFI